MSTSFIRKFNFRREWSQYFCLFIIWYGILRWWWRWRWRHCLYKRQKQRLRSVTVIYKAIFKSISYIIYVICYILYLIRRVWGRIWRRHTRCAVIKCWCCWCWMRWYVIDIAHIFCIIVYTCRYSIGAIIA